MKKTLIALAAVAAATAVSAQSVELYGRMDLGYNSTKTTVPGTKTEVTSMAGAEGGATGSRIGFRGTEDLGGGLKAGFNYEMNIGADNAAGVNTRIANLSVTGGFGTVAIGSFYNVFDAIVGAGANVGLHEGRFTKVNGVSNNAIAYQSPVFNGLTVGVGTFKEEQKINGVTQAAANNLPASSSGSILNARYNSGALSVLAGAMVGGKLYTGAGVYAKASENAVRVSYNLGVAAPYVIIGNNKATAAGSTTKENGYEIGATAPLGNIVAFASIGDATTKLNGTKTVDVSGWKVGANYNLSKRTYAYAAVMSQKDKNGAGVQTKKVDQTRIGLVHMF